MTNKTESPSAVATDEHIYFTAIYRVPKKDASKLVTECCDSAYWSAASWSHALDERDTARAALAAQLPRIRHLEHERDTARRDCAAAQPVVVRPDMSSHKYEFRNMPDGKWWPLHASSDAEADEFKDDFDGSEWRHAQPAPKVPDAPIASPVAISDIEMGALRRFDECAQDGEGHDISAAMMKSLAEIGLVRHISAGRYEHTAFGLYMLSGAQSAIAAQPAPDVAELAEWRRLKDPAVLHASLLRGLPAKLPDYIFRHIAGDAVPISDSQIIKLMKMSDSASADTLRAGLRLAISALCDIASEPSEAPKESANHCLLIDELLASWLSDGGNSPELAQRRINARSALESAMLKMTTP